MAIHRAEPALSLDFVSDSLAWGSVPGAVHHRRLQPVVPECLVNTRFRAIAGSEPDLIAELRGYPCMVVSDNGTE